jgi:phage FluMu protein Com
MGVGLMELKCCICNEHLATIPDKIEAYTIIIECPKCKGIFQKDIGKNHTIQSRINWDELKKQVNAK